MLQFGQLPSELCFAVVEEYNVCAETTIISKIVIFLKRRETPTADDSDS